MLESLFNKVAGVHVGTLLKRDPTQVFSSKICEIFTNTFFYRTALAAISDKNLHMQTLIERKLQISFSR